MNLNSLQSQAVVKRNKSVWNKLKIADMHLDVNLVRCQKYLFPNGRGKKLLYIGFGEGQNLVYLAQQGFVVYGTEIAKSRLKETQKKLKKEKLKADLRLVDSNILSFKDNFFDVVVAWQSLYYNTEETLYAALLEIERVLKPNGKFLSSMVSPRQKLLCYKKIAPLTYRPSPQTGQEKCTIICLKNQRQIRTFYKSFKNIKLGYYSSDLFKSPNFHWVIYCEKKNNGREK